MPYADRRPVSYPEYGISVDVSGPVQSIWTDPDGLWIRAETSMDRMEAEQMPEYLAGQPVSVRTGDMLSVVGEERYTVPGDRTFGIFPRRERFSMHVTDQENLSGREDGFVYPRESEGRALVNLPEPSLLRYDEPFNIAYFILDQVVGVEIDGDEGDSFLDMLGLRESWNELLSEG